MKSRLFTLLLSIVSRAEETQFFFAPTPSALTGIIGTSILTMDTDRPDAPAVAEKLSDEFLEK
jgi:hypothetical protein